MLGGYDLNRPPINYYMQLGQETRCLQWAKAFATQGCLGGLRMKEAQLELRLLYCLKPDARVTRPSEFFI